MACGDLLDREPFLHGTSSWALGADVPQIHPGNGLKKPEPSGACFTLQVRLPAAPVNLNTTTMEQLETLPGILS